MANHSQLINLPCYVQIGRQFVSHVAVSNVHPYVCTNLWPVNVAVKENSPLRGKNALSR